MLSKIFYWPEFEFLGCFQGVVKRLSLQPTCSVDTMMKGNSHDNEIRLAVVGAERTGKSGEFFMISVSKLSIRFFLEVSFSIHVPYHYVALLFSALTVRFLTRRFIGEYDSCCGKIMSNQS